LDGIVVGATGGFLFQSIVPLVFGIVKVSFVHPAGIETLPNIFLQSFIFDPSSNALKYRFLYLSSLCLGSELVSKTADTFWSNILLNILIGFPFSF